MSAPNATAADGPVTLLVGTEKGLFRLSSRVPGEQWQLDGPHVAGYRVQHLVVSPDDPAEVHAAIDHPVWGSHIYRSADGGENWSSLLDAPHHPPGRFEVALNSIWNLAWAPDGSHLYAGIDPAGLFVSADRGKSWSDVTGINEHETRVAWEPSRGLFALHSICIDTADPREILVAVSAGGAYRSEDAGRTWWPANVGVRAENLPQRYPEVGHNVHRVIRHPLRTQRLYRQCYSGVYRSDDGGRSWQEITAGLPSDFGYAIACDPHDPDTLWQIPESSSHMRTTADGQLRVFRSHDAGDSWSSASAGLPLRPAFVTVLREAMATDEASPCGVYFGTSSGHVFASRDRGDQWHLAAELLPRVLCVRALPVPN